MKKQSRRILNEMTMKLRSHYSKEQLMCPPAIIQTLPEEVLIEIFSYLSLGELCNTVSKVCTQWERLHWDRQLYSLPRILDGTGTVQDLFECLDCVTDLASAYFDSGYIRETIRKCLEARHKEKYRTAELTELLILLSHLRKVECTGLESYDLWTFSNKLAIFMRCCFQLEELNVYHYSRFHVRNPLLISLCDQLCDTLRVLHMDFSLWTPEGARALTKCRHLEDLAIREVYTNPKVILLEIANISSLRRLSIDSLYSGTSKTLVSMFSNGALKGLTHLRLKDIPCSEELVVAIGSNLNNLTDLYIFSHRHYNLGNNGLRSIMKGCNKLTNLVLQCSGSHRIGNVILMLTAYLPRLKTLALGIPIFVLITWQATLKNKMPDLVIREIDRYGR